MTADEFRKILDRFHMHLSEAGMWASHNRVDLPRPGWDSGLDSVWRDLSRECSRMKDAEGPLPDPPLKPSDVNAEAIGELQATVARLEGALAALAKRASDLIKERDDALPPMPEQPQEQDVLRLRAPNGDYVDGVIEKWEWLGRPYQEYTEHESEAGVTVKTPGQWNCGTVRLVVRLTSPLDNGRTVLADESTPHVVSGLPPWEDGKDGNVPGAR